MSSRASRAALGPFFAILGLLLVTRMAFVASAADVFFYAEELEKGVPALAMIEGVEVPHAHLPFHLYEGGGFVISHLKALAFLVMGPSLLAHKLVALFTSSLVLAAGYALCVRHGSVRAGVLYGLLFVFSPLAFQKLSLISLGIHFEALGFIYLVLDRGLRVLRADQPARSDLVALGLAVGFGTYFSYQVALAAAWVVLTALLFRRSLLAPRILVTGLLAFLVGLSPWLWMYAQVGDAMFDIHGQDLTGEGRSGLDSLRRLLGAVMGAGPLELGRRLMLPAAFLVLGGRALLERGGPRRIVVAYLMGFAAFWLVAWIRSGFVMPGLQSFLSLQRLAPLFGVAIAVVAISADAALARGGSVGSLARAALALLFVTGTWNGSTVIAEGRPGQAATNLEFLANTRGYNLRGYFAVALARENERAIEERCRPWVILDRPGSELFEADLASSFFQRRRNGLKLLEELVPLTGDREAFILGAGPALWRECGKDFEAALDRVEELPEADRGPWRRAIGRYGSVYVTGRESVAREVALLDGREGADEVLEGIGYRVFRQFVVHPYGGHEFVVKPGAARRWLASLSEPSAGALLRGFDRAAREALLP